MSEVVISVVLVRQEEEEQYLVCYISYLFKGLELHYTSFEKLTIGLTLIARRLCPYFQSHLIVVLIDTLLERILSHSEEIGKLIKCVMELREYDSEYDHILRLRHKALQISWWKLCGRRRMNCR